MKLSDFGEVSENVSLENYNTYGIKTRTKYLIKVKDIPSLIDLLKYLDSNNLKYYLLGKGSNVILPDETFDGVIITLDNLNKVAIKDNLVEAESGVVLAKLVSEVVNNNLGGLESLATIPGTLGGALKGNAGFLKDITIYNYVTSVTVIRNYELVTIPKSEIGLAHRYTTFKENNDIIVKASFELEEKDKEEMIKVIQENREKRINTQPMEYKNAGSVFKNPEGLSSGKLIDEAGLKGLCVGDAEVSEKHANFIVNKGNATSKDIKELIKEIQKIIKEKDNIDLELEQVIVNWG